jgi:hypothetical protein
LRTQLHLPLGLIERTPTDGKTPAGTARKRRP